MIPCPCCGRPIDEDVHAVIATASLSRSERLAVSHLAERFGKWVRLGQVVEAVYVDDPDGGPLTAHQCVYMFLYRADKKLRSLGYAVESTRGGGAHEHRIVRHPA
ncbi:MAG: hypothetical protein J0H94_12975 [Rhizobiales bacterium]|nr:hypothetical protein [Hyphomicrobiales bacterium]